MKKIKSIMAVMALLSLAGSSALIVGCKSMDSADHGSSHVHKYTCPMHPEVVQDSPGSCSKCGMKLVHKN